MALQPPSEPQQFDFNSLMSSLDEYLLRAVEQGDITAAREALTAGADPNCRKTIVLGCTVFDESRVVKSWFKDKSTEKGKGGRVLRYRAVPGESALGLAILGDCVEAVDLLLKCGADPNAMIEWHIVRGRDVWTKDLWQSVVEEGQLDLTMTAANALDLAVGRIEATDATGGRAAVAQLLVNKGEVWINQEGGLIQLVDPSANDTFRSLRIETNRDTVDILLDFGARVSEQAIEAAVKADNYGLIEALQAASAAQQARAAFSVGGSFSKDPDTPVSSIMSPVTSSGTLNSRSSGSRSGSATEGSSGKRTVVRFAEQLVEEFYLD
ncbi:hypothetical protein M427DRAFT_155041 [Gonapodya prolifera JEL478]|uniref:Uncharacterized protein n=1 Tax=Gonapodya prolifera (strain JEL478) TaxID=1344416 RepID=A0A139AH28_GONPJ|nr:hypothetical protein M427DRAFT_155041 [Gonapodya prolifera JEL478]|eukprot:KXS15999.1 hypothetical protein M427DRAFT_155041 [Gonapodya prolifera JEL478]